MWNFSMADCEVFQLTDSLYIYTNLWILVGCHQLDKGWNLEVQSQTFLFPNGLRARLDKICESFYSIYIYIWVCEKLGKFNVRWDVNTSYIDM